jgi:hypothetical protein
MIIEFEKFLQLFDEKTKFKLVSPNRTSNAVSMGGMLKKIKGKNLILEIERIVVNADKILIIYLKS